MALADRGERFLWLLTLSSVMWFGQMTWLTETSNSVTSGPKSGQNVRALLPQTRRGLTLEPSTVPPLRARAVQANPTTAVWTTLSEKTPYSTQTLWRGTITAKSNQTLQVVTQHKTTTPINGSKRTSLPEEAVAVTSPGREARSLPVIMQSTRNTAERVSPDLDWRDLFSVAADPPPTKITEFTKRSRWPRFSGLQGDIVACERPSSESTCMIYVPETMFISALVTVSNEPCPNNTHWNRSDFGHFSFVKFSNSHSWQFPLATLYILYQPSNERYLLEDHYIPKVRIQFKASQESLRNKLHVRYLSEYSGFVCPFGFDGMRIYVDKMSGEFLIQLPDQREQSICSEQQGSIAMLFKHCDRALLLRADERGVAQKGNTTTKEIKKAHKNHFVVLVSFPHFFHNNKELCDFNYFDLKSVNSNGEILLWRNCFKSTAPTQLYNASLKIEYSSGGHGFTGFKMLFSFHKKSRSPQKLMNGLFNCSRPHYASFKQHVHCNLEPECQDGEDEGEHCPFSPRGCQGRVGYDQNSPVHSHNLTPRCLMYDGGSESTKCFRLVVLENPVSFMHARVHCLREGGELAMLKAPGEWEAFRKIFRFGKLQPAVFLGLKNCNETMPDLYTFCLQWLDGTVMYDKNVYLFARLRSQAPYYVDRTPDRILLTGGDERLRHFVCQVEYPTNRAAGVLNKAVRSVRLINDTEAATVTFSNEHSGGLASNRPSVRTPHSAQMRGVRCAHRGVMSPKEANVSLAEGATHLPGIKMVKCKLGHVTHDFLSCDIKSHCGLDDDLSRCKRSEAAARMSEVSEEVVSKHDELDPFSPIVPSTRMSGGHDDAQWVKMFVCDNWRTHIAYTLLCDFIVDCRDRADEESCRHQSVCPGFTCSNGQCIDAQNRCNVIRDCVDGSDEAKCSGAQYTVLHRDVGGAYDILHGVSPFAVVDFDRKGYFTQVGIAVDKACPDTHFRCPGELSYCLPVYVRCNGVYDCPSHEDEADCQNYACPGFYHCRASSVCVHIDHVCDGWPQCPQRDDELLCDYTCPQNCRCQGLAFICRRGFFAHSYPHLRYLEGSGSLMTLTHVSSNGYLVWLRLASCGVEQFESGGLHNLRFLDLSYNKLRTIDTSSLAMLSNLQVLIIKGNPLIFITNSDKSTSTHEVCGRGFTTVCRLGYLDISETLIQIFDSQLFSAFSNMEFLNLSSSPLRDLSGHGFQKFPQLAEVDLRGTAVQNVPNGLFAGLRRLRLVYAENFRMCCPSVLPDSFGVQEMAECITSESDILSCEAFLKSDIYLAYVWVAAILSLAGNAGCIFKHIVTQTFSSGTHFIFLINFRSANFIMGLYLLIVAVTDQIYRGKYFAYENSVTVGYICKTAGSFWFLSVEVSMLMACLITIERYLVLCRASGDVLISSRFTWLCVVAAWSVGIILHSVPLFQQFSHWDFYARDFVCLPVKSSFHSSIKSVQPDPSFSRNLVKTHLPSSNASEFAQDKDYSFAVFTVLHLMLLTLLLTGQYKIYREIRTGDITLDNPPQDALLAKRFFSVALVIFVSCAPMSLVDILHRVGAGITEGLNVRLAMYMVPLMPAINPFLYAYNVRMERQDMEVKARLLAVLKVRMIKTRHVRQRVA